MSAVQVLTLHSSNVDELLRQTQRLARLVFEPEIAEDEHNIQPTAAPQLQLETWYQKLSQDNAMIVYTQDATSETEPSERPATMTGFFLNHPRPRQGNPNSYHIFLAAVHPSARGKNVFSRLLSKTKEIAIEAGYASLTVSTIPERFSTMYSILSRPEPGWTVLEWRDSEQGLRKVVMEMPLK